MRLALLRSAQLGAPRRAFHRREGARRGRKVHGGAAGCLPPGVRSEVRVHERYGDGEGEAAKDIENKTVQEEPVWVAFRRGFFTNALNPKATLFFMSLFTLVISPTTPTSVQVGYGVYMALATWAWFSILSIILSRNNVRGFFQQRGYWFDRGIGIILITLAVRVVI